MRRLLPVSLLLLLAAGAPAATAAQPGDPRPARGRATIVATQPGTSYASFLSRRTLDVTVTYRRRTAARTVQLAVRYRPRRGRCAARPSAADRRRVGAAAATSSRSIFTATGRARFAAGTNVVCVWAKEGSGGYRRPTRIRQPFARALFAATTSEGTLGAGAVTGVTVRSSSPISGTLTSDDLGPGGSCTVRSRAVNVLEIAGLFASDVSVYTGSACTRLAVQVSGSAGSASLAVGPTGVGAPVRVVQHAGACNAAATRPVPVTAPAAADFLAAAGCRLGRVLPGTNETAARAGQPASGTVYATSYRGRAVDLAPRGTTVDVRVDTIR